MNHLLVGDLHERTVLAGVSNTKKPMTAVQWETCVKSSLRQQYPVTDTANCRPTQKGARHSQDSPSPPFVIDGNKRHRCRVDCDRDIGERMSIMIRNRCGFRITAKLFITHHISLVTPEKNCSMIRGWGARLRGEAHCIMGWGARLRGEAHCIMGIGCVKLC